MKTFSKSMLLLAAAIIFPMAAFAGPVNINTADAATISAELEGVGLTRAQAIVDYRKAHGPFKSYEDLTLVKGIGTRTVDINRANILFKSAEKKKK